MSRHQEIIRREIQEFADNGIDYALNYHVAFETWQEIRRARGMIIRSLMDDERAEREYDSADNIKKLSATDIDRLCNLVTLASVNNGVLFWTKELKPDNSLFAVHIKVLQKIRAMCNEIQEPDTYARYGLAQVMYTMSDYVIAYFKNGVPRSDNLGSHFTQGRDPHVFMHGISVKALKRQIDDNPTTIVVLIAAASSGVFEAGIFAHYMNTMLHIPTTIDPVFFSKDEFVEPINIINSTLPKQNVIAIPLDDRVLGTGYSPREARRSAERKYGLSRLVMSKKMSQF